MRKNQSQPSSPQINHRKRAIKLINQLTKTQKSKKSQQLQYKVRTLTEINKQIQASTKRNPASAEIFATDQLIIYIRYYFVENISRCPCLTFFRLIMVSEEITRKFLSHNIPVYVARLIEKEEPKSKSINHEDQIHEGLKLLGQWTNRFPKTFPKLLLSTLVSFAELPVVEGFQQRKKDHIPLHLKQLAIQILINYSTKSTKMFAFSGGFTLLSNLMMDPTLHQKSQAIVHRFIYFFNQKKNRDTVSDYINLKKMFSIFTDLDNTFLEDSSRLKGNMENSTKFQRQLEIAKRGIVALIKSWAGVIYLGDEGSTLRSFLQALKQIPKKQNSEVRRIIFSIIQQILSIGDNLISTEGFNFTQNEFRVTNLVNCYVVTLIQLLLQNDLFKTLIELSGVEEVNIAQNAQKLLKKLSIYIFNFLPDCSQYIDFLISAASKTDPTSAILKSSSSFIMSKIGNYIYQKPSKLKNQQLNQLQTLFNLNSIYVSSGRININAIAKTLHTLTYKQNQNQRVELINSNPIPKQFKEEYKKWSWDVIEELFAFPDRFKDSSRLDSHEKHKEGKIFKYLLRFFSHTRGSFSELKWSEENFQFIKVGKLFIRTAITIPEMLPLVKNPPQSQFQCTVSFMGQLQKLLQTTLIGCSKIRNNFYQPFFKNLQRQLLLWIGLFSQNKVGYEVLLCQNNFFQLLYQFIPRPQCALIIFGLMLYLDFYRYLFHQPPRQNMSKKLQNNLAQGKYIVIGPRALLKKCIREGSRQLRILSLEIVKLLFKAELVGFPSDGFRMMIYLMSLEDGEVAGEVLECMECLMGERDNVGVLLACLIEEEAKEGGKWGVIKQKLQSYPSILIRLLSLDIGFTFITNKLPQFLQHQYTSWQSSSNQHSYLLTLQSLLSQTLNFTHTTQPHYKIQNCKSIYQLGFLYKLPWIIYLNDEEIPAYVKMTKDRFLLYYNFDNVENYEQLRMFAGKCLRVCLGVGDMFVNQSLKYVKDKVVKELALDKQREVLKNGERVMVVRENGISVYFKEVAHDMTLSVMNEDNDTFATSIYEIVRIQLQIKIYFTQPNSQLPLHLIQQLTKTQSGLQFLTQKQFLTHTQAILTSPTSTPLELRSALWSLGYYGSTKLGITQLIQHHIAQQIINMSFQCQILSLRGTSRYILNMFCHSQTGRSFMVSKGFIVNKKSLNCFPKDYRKFYEVKKVKYCHYSMNEQYWGLFDKVTRPMSQNETKLYNLISQLINALSYKQSITSVKQMMKSSLKVIHSFNLLQNVINLLTFYKFRNDARKNIYLIFQQFFKSPDFNTNVQDKIVYITSQDVENVEMQVQQDQV